MGVDEKTSDVVRHQIDVLKQMEDAVFHQTVEQGKDEVVMRRMDFPPRIVDVDTTEAAERFDSDIFA